MKINALRTACISVTCFLAAYGPSQPASALNLTISPGQSVQAALDQIGAAGGGTLYVNSGNYLGNISEISNYTTMKGEGSTRPVLTLNTHKNTQVITNKSVPFTNITCDFISVNGGLTDAEMDAGTYNNTLGIDLSDHHNTVTNTNGTIVNCYATNCSMGYNMGRILAGNARLDTCSVTNCGGAPIGSTPGLHNIYISTCNPFLATYVTSTYCRTGIGLKVTDFYGTSNLTDNVVDHCTCTNNAGAPGVHDGDGIAVYNLVNPTIQYCSSNNNNGNGLFVADNDGAHTATVKNSTFTGNYSQVNVSYDIYMINVTNPTVTGCVYNTHNGF